MRQCFLLPFLIFALLAPFTVAVPQAPLSTQATSTSMAQLPKWTEADRKAVLAKAQRGDTGSQFWLGAGYEQGWFGKTDFQQALKWLRKAAAHGDPDAQVNLGQMYKDGEGVQQNYKLAAKWYRKAAEHIPDFGGAGQGRNDLGMLYLDGRGVPKDYVQAYMWFSLTNFKENLIYAKAQMTPAQILEAERRATEWKRHHPNPLQDGVLKEVPQSCPVTKPPSHPFVPPSPYPRQTSSSGFWFGTDKLWIELPADGTWKGLSHYRPTDTAFRQKLFWWREGYDWHNDAQPMLKVTGKSLDSPAPPLATDEHANAGWTGDSNHPFIVVGIAIPTLGCWKITGRFEDAELSFVIWVAQ